jgi:hypothetical protein
MTPRPTAATKVALGLRPIISASRPNIGSSFRDHAEPLSSSK